MTVEELKIVLQTVFEDDGAAEMVKKQIKDVVKAYDEEQKAAKATREEEKRANAEKKKSAQEQKAAAQEQANAKKAASDKEKRAAREAAEAERLAAQQAKETAAAQAAAFAAMSAACAKGFSVIIQSINAGIDALNQYEAATKGLNSIASGRGIDMTDLKEQMDGVTDAFFNATDAAASYKNLLSRGYTLDQATTVIERLKDAAAFGRQASLTLGEAVKSATEGIKNENSILVDNAGVTKNVAKMWEDYAKARGLVTTNLTQAQKVEAEYLGILEETALQVGDCAKAADTLAGKQAELTNTTALTTVAFGAAMAPAVGLATDAANTFMSILQDIVEECPGLAAGVTTGALAITGLGVATTAAKAVMSLAKAAGSLGISLGPVGLAIAGIAVVTGVLTQAQAKEAEMMSIMSEQAALRVQEHNDEVKRREDEITNLANLSTEYETLTNKTFLTTAEKARLAQIEETLATDHGIVTEAVQGQAGAYGTVTEQIRELIKAKQDELIEIKRNDLYIARMAAEEGSRERRKAKEDSEKTDNQLRPWFTASDRADAAAKYEQMIKEDYAPVVANATDYIKTALSDGFGGVQDELAEQISRVFTAAANASTEAIQEMANENYADAIIAMFDDIDLTGVQDRIREQKIEIAGANGIIDTDEEAAKLAEFSATMGDEIDAVFAPITEWATQMGASDLQLSELNLSLGQMKQGLLNTGDAALVAGRAYGKMGEDGKKAMEKEQAAQEDLISGSNELTEASERTLSSQALAKRAREVADSYKEVGDATAEWSEELKGYADVLGVSEGDMDAFMKKLDELDANLAADIANIDLQMKTTSDSLLQLAESFKDPITGEVRVENQQAYNAIMGILAAWNGLREKMGLSTFTIDAPKGSGGGKSKAEREAEEAKRAAEEAKRAQEEEYRKALERIDHLKTLDQLTAEQEIDMLLEVQRVHAKTAEQRMEMEEKLYTARKELAEKRYDDALDEIDHLLALDKISADEELAMLLKIQEQYALTEEQRREMAEKVYAAQKELQQQAYDDALNGIDRKTRMDQIGAEEEIALLEEVARVHAQTAEQRLDIEERLYEARKQLAAQQYSDALSEVEHLLAMDQVDDAGELAMLEHIQSVYAKTEEQRREMEERIYQARKQIQDDAFNDELSRIERLRSRAEVSTREQIELLEQLALTHAQTAEQQEKAADKIYEAKQKLFSEELSHIAELKTRGEISAQEQLEQLEEIAKRAELTAQMRIDMEKQIYQAQQALRKEEEAHINRLNKGIVDALKSRYEEQRDAEIEHLNESKQAWKDWSDETCKSIQAQIDAIDKQAEAEDREKTDAENLRAIDKAKQALLYETDDYNRRELEKQIAQLEEKRAEQLKEWKREDQKDALRDEMEAVKDKAQAEQEAIQSEIDRVKELYAERLKAASLQAEAERLLMKGNQEEILELIGSYAPDYEATGKTLGERLFAGIQSAMGNITDWYAAFVEGIDRIQQNIAQQTLDSIDRMHAGQYANKVNQPGEAKGVTVNQYMTFETPVESPADTARRVKQMNQRLADML